MSNGKIQLSAPPYMDASILKGLESALCERLEDALREHGTVDRILTAIEKPDWNCNEATHDWRNAVPTEVSDIWEKLDRVIKMIVYLMAVRSENWG